MYYLAKYPRFQWVSGWQPLAKIFLLGAQVLVHILPYFVSS
jgi:hypothetical protein